MKKLVLACALTLSATAAVAGDTKLIVADDSVYTGLCIAATESREALDTARKEAGLSTIDLRDIRCNGKSLQHFGYLYSASTVEAASEASELQSTTYLFNSEDNSIETRLCLAAVTSSDEFAELRSQHFATVPNLDKTVQCNGMPLSRFIQKYSTTSKQFVSSTR